jgi:hypothetical protein
VTHKQQIKEYLQGKDFIMGAEIKRHFANLYISDADRRCREMAEDGELESKIENGKVYYRIKQSDIVRRFEALKKPQPEKIASLF